MYLNYINCGLSHETVACFCNVCVTEKKSREKYEGNFQDVYTITAINMTSQVTCSLTLYLVMLFQVQNVKIGMGYIYENHKIFLTHDYHMKITCFLYEY